MHALITGVAGQDGGRQSVFAVAAQHFGASNRAPDPLGGRPHGRHTHQHRENQGAKVARVAFPAHGPGPGNQPASAQCAPSEGDFAHA